MIWILYLFMYIHNSLITVLWPSQLVQEFIQQQHFPSIFDPIASKHPSSVEFPSSMDQWFPSGKMYLHGTWDEHQGFKHTKNQSFQRNIEMIENKSLFGSVGGTWCPTPSQQIFDDTCFSSKAFKRPRSTNTNSKKSKVHVDFGSALGVSETCRRWAQQDAIMGDVESHVSCATNQWTQARWLGTRKLQIALFRPTLLIQLTNFHHAHPCPSILQCLNMTVYIISGLLAPQHGSSKAKCHWVSNVSRIFSSWISQQGRYANAFVMKVQIQMKLLEFRPHSRCPTSFYWSHQSWMQLVKGGPKRRTKFQVLQMQLIWSNWEIRL